MLGLGSTIFQSQSLWCMVSKASSISQSFVSALQSPKCCDVKVSSALMSRVSSLELKHIWSLELKIIWTFENKSTVRVEVPVNKSVGVEEHPGRENILSVAVGEVSHNSVTNVVAVDPELVSATSDGWEEHLGGGFAPVLSPLQHHQPRPRVPHLPTTCISVLRGHPHSSPLFISLVSNTNSDIKTLWWYVAPHQS